MQPHDRFAIRPGLLFEDVTPAWAVFNPGSGETHLLNESAAIVLQLLDVGPMDARQIASAINDDLDPGSNVAESTILDCLLDMTALGLLTRIEPRGPAT